MVVRLTPAFSGLVVRIARKGSRFPVPAALPFASQLNAPHRNSTK